MADRNREGVEKEREREREGGREREIERERERERETDRQTDRQTDREEREREREVREPTSVFVCVGRGGRGGGGGRARAVAHFCVKKANVYRAPCAYLPHRTASTLSLLHRSLIASARHRKGRHTKVFSLGLQAIRTALRQRPAKRNTCIRTQAERTDNTMVGMAINGSLPTFSTSSNSEMSESNSS